MEINFQTKAIEEAYRNFSNKIRPMSFEDSVIIEIKKGSEWFVWEYSKSPCIENSDQSHLRYATPDDIKLAISLCHQVLYEETLAEENAYIDSLNQAINT